MLEQSAKIKDADLKVLIDDRWMNDVYSRYSLKSLDDMYAMIGCGGISTTQILNKLISCYTQYNTEHKDFDLKPVSFDNKQETKSSISELGSMMIKFARCCNAVPGDEIVGFVSRGRGVTIHKKDCKALKSLDADRIMELSWNKDGKETTYLAGIRLIVKDTSGVLANIANKIAEQKINITSISSKAGKDGTTIVDVSVAIQNKTMLDDLMQKLKNVKDVYEVFRGENI